MVFAGVFEFLGVFVVVNRGEVVVNCVVNRGAWRTLFHDLKTCQLSEIYFWTRPVLVLALISRALLLRYSPKSGQSSCQTLPGR